MAIQLMSNVKIITSGNVPTTANLLPGQAAFGKLTSDGKYHLFGNTGEGDGAGKVVDIVLDTYSALSAPDIETILSTGNKAKTNLLFVDNNDKTLIGIDVANQKINITDADEQYVNSLTKDGITLTETVDADTKRKVYINSQDSIYLQVDANNTSEKIGFDDTNLFYYTVGGTTYHALTSYENQSLTETEKATMRTLLSVYSKSEIDGKIAGAYHTKGSVAANALPTEGNQVGDVYNITANTTGVKDIHGQTIKVGDNVVWVEISGETTTYGWDTLSGVVDLSAYYTSEQVDKLIENLQTAINANSQSITEVTDRVKTLEDAGYLDQTAVENYLTTNNYVKDAKYVHTDANYTEAEKLKVANLVTDGDGTKVLTDDGTYAQLELSVVEI